MPRQSKATVKPPTIQERDKQLKDMMNEAERQATNPPAPDDGLPTLTDEPTPAETTSTNGVSLMRLGKTSDGKELTVEMWPDKHKQRLAEMARDENRIHGEFSTDAPTPAGTPIPAKPTPPPLRVIREGHIPRPSDVVPVPLVTLHLRRVGPILTDTGETVRIPAPARLPDGARVSVSIYRED